MVALYAVCVVAPPAALALSSGALSANCLSKDSQFGMMQDHHHGDTNVSAHNHSTSADELGPADDKNDKTGNHSRTKICCGISCMSAIPANEELTVSGEAIAVKLNPSVQQFIVGFRTDFLNRPPIAF
jgi:hypothetical protein